MEAIAGRDSEELHLDIVRMIQPPRRNPVRDAWIQAFITHADGCPICTRAVEEAIVDWSISAAARRVCERGAYFMRCLGYLGPSFEQLPISSV